MPFLVITILLLLLGLPLQYYLIHHYKDIAKGFLWVIFLTYVFILLMNILSAFPTFNDYLIFFDDYGYSGIFAFILKVGFILSPVVVHAIFYFVVSKRIKKPVLN